MDDLIKSMLLNIISQIVEKDNPYSQEEKKQTNREPSSYVHINSIPKHELDMLPGDLCSSPNFVAEDIFPDLNVGEGITSSNLCKLYNYSEIATQTSQSLLGHFADSTVQTSQTLISSDYTISSSFCDDQTVPVSVPQVDVNIKIRRIGLSKRARTNPLHKLKK